MAFTYLQKNPAYSNQLLVYQKTGWLIKLLRMGFVLTDRHSWILCFLQLASLLRAVSSTGACESVFKGFSACLLSLGENMVNYPHDLDDLENLHTVCSYWSDFLSCTSSAVAECQDDAVELWEKLKVPSGNLNYRGSLFQLCSKDNGAAGLGFALELVVCAVTVSKLVMWMIWE